MSLQITYQGLSPSEPLSRLIRKETDKLYAFFDRIVSCHVRVDQSQGQLGNARPFRVRIDLVVPGSELCIDTARHKGDELEGMHKDPALTVRDAFRRARRRIQDYARGRQPR